MHKSTLADLYGAHDAGPVSHAEQMTAPGFIDREVRYPAQAPVHLIVANSTYLNGFLVNQSTYGACFTLEGQAVLRVGDRIHVRIAQENLARRAVVIWREARDIGVAFIRV